MTPRQRFRTLVAPHVGALYGFAFRLERDPVRAEDLVQETLVTALEKLGQLRDEAAASVWLARILYRRFLDRAARRREDATDPALLSNIVQLPLERQPDAETVARELGRALTRALARLPEAQRSAIWLVDGQGFRYGEAAEVLGVPPGTVASRVARARLALRVDLRAVAVDQGVIR
jgi:RNA polymerase sigma-70 factor (ECF subfamily)